MSSRAAPPPSPRSPGQEHCACCSDQFKMGPELLVTHYRPPHRGASHGRVRRVSCVCVCPVRGSNGHVRARRLPHRLPYPGRALRLPGPPAAAPRPGCVLRVCDGVVARRLLAGSAAAGAAHRAAASRDGELRADQPRRAAVKILQCNNELCQYELRQVRSLRLSLFAASRVSSRACSSSRPPSVAVGTCALMGVRARVRVRACRCRWYPHTRLCSAPWTGAGRRH